MNVLSLFDGISCGRVALDRAGISVDKYYAAEIDKWAKSITAKNWPDTIQLGDVKDYLEWNIDWSSIDLLIGGSPCQSFSNAGNGKAFDDERGMLFFLYVKILNHIRQYNPAVKFLLENVKMKVEHRDVISARLGVAPVEINSRLVSALNRPRYYWANFEITQPSDRGVVLGDIMENWRGDLPWLSDAAVARLDTINERAKRKGLGYKDCIVTRMDKYLNLDANFYKGADGKRGVITQIGGLRMPSVLECERLQTIPEGYTEGVSNTQRYKALGNGWTVDVISHIFKCMQEAT